MTSTSTYNFADFKVEKNIIPSMAPIDDLNPTYHTYNGGGGFQPPQFLDSGAFNIDLRGSRF